jgi:hypothetical protein
MDDLREPDAETGGKTHLDRRDGGEKTDHPIHAHVPCLWPTRERSSSRGSVQTLSSDVEVLFDNHIHSTALHGGCQACDGPHCHEAQPNLLVWVRLR